MTILVSVKNKDNGELSLTRAVQVQRRHPIPTHEDILGVIKAGEEQEFHIWHETDLVIKEVEVK